MEYTVDVTKFLGNETLINASVNREGLERILDIYAHLDRRSTEDFMRGLNLSRAGVNTVESDIYRVEVTKTEPAKIDWREVARDWADHWRTWDGSTETYALMAESFWKARGGFERYFFATDNAVRPVQRTHFES